MKSQKSNKGPVKNNNANTAAMINNNNCNNNASLERFGNHRLSLSINPSSSISLRTGSSLTTMQSMNTTASSNNDNQPFYISTSSYHNVANQLQSQRMQMMYDSNHGGYYNGANESERTSYYISRSSDDIKLLDADFDYITSYRPDANDDTWDMHGNNAANNVNNENGANTSYSLWCDKMKKSQQAKTSYSSLTQSSMQQQSHAPSYHNNNYISYAMPSQGTTTTRQHKSNSFSSSTLLSYENA